MICIYRMRCAYAIVERKEVGKKDWAHGMRDIYVESSFTSNEQTAFMSE